jgi:hypothetical protein
VSEIHCDPDSRERAALTAAVLGLGEPVLAEPEPAPEAAALHP